MTYVEDIGVYYRKNTQNISSEIGEKIFRYEFIYI